MLDFLLVLGQIPGTTIQLSFSQLCFLMLLAIWLIYHKHYRLVWAKIRLIARHHKLADSLRALVLWLYFSGQKPRQRLN